MIYLDSSALIKLYVEESYRRFVVETTRHADALATSAVTYAEARAGLARRWRERDFTDQGYRNAVADLTRDWMNLTRIQASDHVVHNAGVMAERHSLRGFDAIQLASALRLAEETTDVHVLAFDRRLVTAAVQAGLTVFAVPT